MNAPSADLDISVRYLSGGGAGYMPVKVRAMVQPRPVSFPDFDGVAFANGQVKEGLEKNAEPQWYSDEYLFEEGGRNSTRAPRRPGQSPAEDGVAGAGRSRRWPRDVARLAGRSGATGIGRRSGVQRSQWRSADQFQSRDAVAVARSGRSEARCVGRVQGHA